MRILAIESSCDDTSISIIESSQILITTTAAQDIHKKFGGVMPEYASREHLDTIKPLLDETLLKANILIESIDAFAVTYAPGLIGSLLVGVNFIKGLALSLDKPLIGIHHLEGHIAANYINNPNWQPPFICLLVSGGHTQLIYIKSYFEFEILGSSIDDAVGEAFDKTAKLLGLPYPGGPEIDRLAKTGNENAIPFKAPYVNNNNLDFSFSGYKTSVLTYLQKNPDTNIADLCASFQKHAIESLLIKLKRASELYNCKNIAIAGGVSANTYLRKKIEELKNSGYRVNIPSLAYCTDNAAMIAMAAELRIKHGFKDSLTLNAIPSLRLA